MPPNVLFSVAASIITPQEPATCAGAEEITIVVVQLAAAVHVAPVPGATVLTSVPELLAVVETTTCALPPPDASPVGMVQVSVLPAMALQVAPVGVTWSRCRCRWRAGCPST